MSEVKLTEFHVIRHGETRENVTGIIQGQLNTQLDETGRKQAEAAAARLSGQSFDLLLSSDLDRAVETASVIAQKIRFAERRETPELREWDLGEMEGAPAAEIQAKYPERYACFGKETNVELPGGESSDEFYGRIDRCLDTLALQEAGKRILIVTHAGCLRAMFRHVAGLPRPGCMLPRTDNASYTHFIHNGKMWRLVCWNDTSHLQTLRESKAL